MTPIRVAVVGLGYWGPNLVRNLHDLEAADVVLACDSRAERREAIARRYPALELCADFNDVLASEIDAVVIATPITSHFTLAAEALEAGLHVLVEKPLATSTSDALALIRLARENNRVLMPGHTFLYSPSVVAIHDLIASGDLGEPYFISMSRVNLGLHQPDASVVWDLAPHDFSILRYWLGEVPNRLSTTGRGFVIPSIPDVAFISLEFASRIIAHVELSWLSPSKLRHTTIVCSEKMVIYDDTSNEPVRVFDSGVHLPDPDTFGEYRLTYRTGDILSPRVDATEPLALELQDFCDAIAKGTPTRSSAIIGLDVVRMVEAADHSLTAGGEPYALESIDERRRSTSRGSVEPPAPESE
jgi:predicted dehydrogenase